MKQHILLLLSFWFTATASTQNVLVGTGTPVSQAALEIRSSSKGLLIPRMSSVNRLAIPSPAAGLMVFETTTNRLYKHDGTDWKYVIDNTFWDRNGTNIYNSNDSIGVNTFFVDERFHIGGNVQLTNGDLEMFKSTGTTHLSSFDYTGPDADGTMQQIGYNYQGFNKGYLRFRNFTAAGEDQLTIGFSASPLWIMKSSGATILNSVNPILQLQANGTDKGFFQLSGNDVRIGTNSGNTNGNFIIRTNGSDRLIAEPGGDVGIGIASPTASLHIGGDVTIDVNAETAGDVTAANIELSSKLVKTTGPAFFNLLPYAHGYFNISTLTCTCSNNQVTITKFGPGN
ncbi:MAG TPA: hypothetical protein VIZ28_12575, partial [Chitinophagaceae bacterium]